MFIFLLFLGFDSFTCKMSKKTEILKPPKKRKDMQVDIPIAHQKASTVNLEDWVGSQILAKDGDYYYPGTLQEVTPDNSVVILFDASQTTKVYHNIIDSNDILNNCSPPAIMIKVGVPVCVRINHDAHFTVGKVTQVRSGPPMQCLVQISNSVEDAKLVNRALVRLLQPPWFDDLEDTGGQEVSLSYAMKSQFHAISLFV